jgi:hypothetical protein
MKITEAQKIAYALNLDAALAKCKKLEEWAYTVSREFAYEGLEIDGRSTIVSWLGRGKDTRTKRMQSRCLDSLEVIFRSMPFEDVLLASRWLVSAADCRYKGVNEEPYWKTDHKTGRRYYNLSDRWWGEKVFEEELIKLKKWKLGRVNWLLRPSSKYAVCSLLLKRAKSFKDCRQILDWWHTGKIGQEVFQKMCSLAITADDHFAIALMLKGRGNEELWKKHVLLCVKSL